MSRKPEILDLTSTALQQEPVACHDAPRLEPPLARDERPAPTVPVTRRHLIGGLGALLAAACGGSESDSDGASGSGGSPPRGSGGAPAGGAPGAGGRATGGAATGGTAGQPAGSAGADPGAAGSAGAASGGAGGAGGVLSPPPFDDVPTCVASRTDAAGQGPFFIHDLEVEDDVELARQDIRGRYHESAEPGVEMHLHLRILDATSTSCNAVPVPDVDVYIWHTDAQGYYSGFGTRGGSNEQSPDSPYTGSPNANDLDNTDRFCRGLQTTDAHGVVSFRSIFPGWYNGRDLHIHLVAFKRGSPSRGRVTYNDGNSDGTWLFTTQFYFDPAFSRRIHENNQPYLRRTTLAAYVNAMAADEPGNSGLRAKATLSGDDAGVGGVVTAQMQILLDPKA